MQSTSPAPCCPHCRAKIEPRTDILWDSTGAMKLSGVTVIYCGFCGAILGGVPQLTLSKRRRG